MSLSGNNRRALTLLLVLAATTAGAFAGSWTPSNMVTKAWYDASDATNIVGKVSQWKDKSGYGRNLTQGTASAQPSTGSTINGLNAIEATSDNNHRMFSTSTAWNRSSMNTTIAIVLEKVSAGTEFGAAVGAGTTSGYEYLEVAAVSTGVRVNTRSSPVLDTGTVGTDVRSTPSLVVAQTTSTSLGVWQDGASVYSNTMASATPIANANNILSVFDRRDTAGDTFLGKIGEIVIIQDAALSTENRLKLEGYLAHKWGLEANLPTGHTYKASAPAGFTPIDVSPAAWYDASDAATVVANVSQWLDKSGNGNNITQGTATYQPDTGSRTINDLNVINFTGNDVLGASFAISSANISIVSVKQIDDIVSTSERVWAIRRLTDAQGLINRMITAVGYRNPENSTISITATTDVEIVVYVKSGTSSQKAWQDGTALTENTTTLTTFTSEELAVGAQRDTSPPWVPFDGAVAEFIVIDSALNDTDRQKMEGYLAWKWGLQGNLPADHPYKNRAPGSYGGTVIVLN